MRRVECQLPPPDFCQRTHRFDGRLNDRCCEMYGVKNNETLGHGPDRESCGIGVVFLFLLKRWNYVPPLLIGVLGQTVLTCLIEKVTGRIRPRFDDISAIPYPAFPVDQYEVLRRQRVKA